jgi:hypothetical protein
LRSDTIELEIYDTHGVVVVFQTLLDSSGGQLPRLVVSREPACQHPQLAELVGPLEPGSRTHLLARRCSVMGDQGRQQELHAMSSLTIDKT